MPSHPVTNASLSLDGMGLGTFGQALTQRESQVSMRRATSTMSFGLRA